MNENEISDIIVIVGDDGITPINTISEKTFHAYILLSDNEMKIIEKSGMQTTFKIKPHNKHALRFAKKWSA
jgi:hypothetical protein